MRYILMILLFFTLFSSSVTSADEDVVDTGDGLHPLLQFAAFEGILAGMSWLGTTDFAGVFVITHPWALAEALHDRNDTLFYTGVISAEALAIYSISLDEDKYDRSDRFKKNMIAWHVFFGIVSITDWLTNDGGDIDWYADDEDERFALSYIPLADGGGFSARFRY